MAGATYHNAAPTYANAYLWPALARFIASRDWPERRAFDLGCGNGATCRMIMSLGFDAIGVDTSESGIAIARASGVGAHLGSAYDDPAAEYGRFPLVVSLEVIEHCIDPRGFAKAFLGLIAPGGAGFLSTPYHGYLKNLALALAGGMDRHFDALADDGHVKFFSIATLRGLFEQAGASDLEFQRIGRIPPLARSMVAIVRTASL
jgi:2-polyprenyl-3-methyl-5-hydroxy-6-metoxy-1,4-benzoquinol methylase